RARKSNCLFQAHARDLDFFIIVQILGGLLKAGGEINVYTFFTISWRDIELANLSELAGAITKLLFKFARGGFFGRLAGLDASGSYFQGIPAQRITPLPDQGHCAVFKKRQRARAPIMMDDFDLDLSFMSRIKPAQR